ncbi:unnamed protein product [Chondrus crispus]|uniref:Uncharacterized protein n=1 Tax=Chondrus crispus TaxID=2769 RepID=R7QPS5_CHOCR|nr:unnamed protein product [Chondrus crispus]CDF40109.1 unnamed protein product [Chondrus crispus]|eukprot:XP_005710403.1 unnamed protein product [Chondrus crispus]
MWERLTQSPNFTSEHMLPALSPPHQRLTTSKKRVNTYWQGAIVRLSKLHSAEQNRSSS